MFWFYCSKPFFYYSAEGNNSKVVVAFCFGFAATSLFCCSVEGDGNVATIAFCFGLATTSFLFLFFIARKAMVTTLPSPFVLVLLQQRRRRQSCHHLFCYSKPFFL
jgi:hypothetical protein